MGAPKPAAPRIWPNGIPADLGPIHAPTCDRLTWTATWCPCGHVERVIAHNATPERIAAVRVFAPTYQPRG